jgi:predicted nucleic acid-binding protein
VQDLGAELVVDTSVVVKFFTEEAEDVAQADRVFRAALSGSLHLVAPDFLVAEFLSGLWRKTLLGDLTHREADRKAPRSSWRSRP